VHLHASAVGDIVQETGYVLLQLPNTPELDV